MDIVQHGCAQPVCISIYVPTYNHECYIARALDSIRMQQTQYTYEVFVGEDCSTDNTRQVLKDWETANPDNRFHIFYREKNMHGSACSNAKDLKLRCKGKYIICLEGDDFWTDPCKLQTQVDFLEAHPEYYAVAHNCTVVGADSEPTGERYPQCTENEYTLQHFFSEILPGQYTTLLSRNYMTDPEINKALLERQGGAGDRRVYFSILCHSRIYCIQKSMSAYRHNTTGGSSFSATFRYSYDKLEQDFRAYMEYAYAIDHPKAIAYTEMVYRRNIRHARRKGYIDSRRAKQDIAHIRHPFRAAMLVLKRDINYRILHKRIYV